MPYDPPSESSRRDRRKSPPKSRPAPKPPKPPKPSPLPGLIDPQTGKVVMPADQFKPVPPKRQAEILRRQRLLKANGYKVVVDGVWGSRSQRAWQDYLRRNRAGQTAPFKIEGAKGMKPLPVATVGEKVPKGVAPEVVTPQEARLAAVEDRERLARERKKRDAQFKAAIQARAARLNANPHNATKMTRRQLFSVLLDPEMKMNPQESEVGARALQYWLRSRGYRVRVTGRYDKETHGAVEQAEIDAKKKADAAVRKAIMERYYGPAGIKPGEKVPWMPTYGNVVPTPKELAKILAGGGFTAQVLIKELLAHALPGAGELGKFMTADMILARMDFAGWRDKQLIDKAAEHSPIIQMMLAMGMTPPMPFVLSILLGVRDFLPYPDLSDVPEEFRDDVLRSRNTNPENIAKNAEIRMGFQADVKALANSSSLPEAKRKFAELMKQQEDEFLAFQKEVLSRDLPWWADAMNAIFLPGEQIRYGLAWVQTQWTHGLTVGGRGGVGPQHERPTFEDAKARYDAMPWYTRLGIEIAVDPLNYAHPFRAASTILRFGREGSKLGTYRLVDKAGGKAWVYEKGTWSKLAGLDRAARFTLPTHFQPAYEQMIREAYKLGQLRDVAIARASEAVHVRVRNGFQKPKHPAAGKGYKASPADADPELRHWRDRAKAWILQSPELQPLLAALEHANASIYIDAGREEYSNIGASILANLAEKARIGAVHQLASDSVDDMYRVLRGRGITGAELRGQIAEHYEKLIQDAGVYIIGGPGDKELGRAVYRRTTDFLDDLENVVLPAMQDILENKALRNGLELFDGTTGLWLHAGDDPAKALRELAADSFDEFEEVNPQFGHGFTKDEMYEAIESEVRRRKPRLWNYWRRTQAAAGISERAARSTFDPVIAGQQMREEIIGAFKQNHRDGLYYDTRETVLTSRLYARHLPSAHQAMSVNAKRLLLDENASLPDDAIIESLSAPPAMVADGPIDEGLFQFMWIMGSRYKYRPDLADHPTRIMHMPDAPADLSKAEVTEWRAAEMARGGEFQKIVASSRIQIEAYSERAMAMELVNQRLFMLALAKSQARFAKAAYWALVGPMLMWRFATLPLRLGWVVRNQVDNVVKAIIAGVRDPRWFLLGAASPGQGAKTVFEIDLSTLRQAIVFLDGQFGTNVAEGFDRVVNMVWSMPNPVLKKLFGSHGIPDLSDAVLDDTRLLVTDAPHRTRSSILARASAADYRLTGRTPPEKLLRDEAQRELARLEATGMIEKMTDEKSLAEIQRMRSVAAGNHRRRFAEKMAKAPDTLWHLMGSRPENYMKRVIYRAKYEQAVRELRPLYTDIAPPFGAIHRGDFQIDPRVEAQIRADLGVPDEVKLRIEFEDDYYARMLAAEESMSEGINIEALNDYGLGDSPGRVRKQVVPQSWISEGDRIQWGDETVTFIRFEELPMSHEAWPGQGMLVRFADGREGHVPKAAGEDVVQVVPADDEGVGRRHPGSLFDTTDPKDQEWVEGVFIPDTQECVITFSDELLHDITSLEELDFRVGEATFTMIHEIRHSTQFKSPFQRRVAEWQMEKYGEALPRFNRLFGNDTRFGRLMLDKIYRLQLHEIDANTTATFLQRKYRGLVRYTGPDYRAPVNEAALHVAAHDIAWDAVTATLFDYSRVTAIEDNFKVFFPFIQYWRKNSIFWVGNFADKPWLANAVLQMDDARREAHADLPPWMQRYIHREEIVDAAAVVPGLDAVVAAMLPDDAMFDPMSFLSFAPLYRTYRNAFYGDNQLLPGENAGIAILGPMLDGMNDFGLPMNPFFRKPLEAAGIATERSWQAMFPQTPLVSALARNFISDDAAMKIADWESVFGRLPLGTSSDSIAENFEFYVQQEIAGQVERGEEPNREKAEATIRAWFLTQNVWGYFSGVYWRRATPEDIYIAKMQSDTITGKVDYDSLSAKDKKLLRLWSMRGMDRMSYDRYIAMMPLVEAYYATTDPVEKAQMVEKTPELRRYVSSAYKKHPFGDGEWWVRSIRRYTETSRFFHALSLIEAVDPAPDVREAAMDIFATPKMRRRWKANDTPAQERRREVRGEVFRYYRDLNNTFFSIPETDHEARDSFLAEHPELVRHWHRNNDPVDDWEALHGSVNAELREQYFNIVESYADEDEGFKAAAPFLKAHPFIFDDTKSAGKINEQTGEWKFTWDSAKKKGWTRERFDMFKQAEPHLRWFFDQKMPQVGEDAAWKWLDEAVKAKNKIAMLIQAYMTKYGQGKADWSAERRAAFAQAKPHLEWFFDVFMEQVGEDAAWAWLNSSETPKAAIIRGYLKKYGKSGQKHLDYLKVRRLLKKYWGMDAQARASWIAAGSPEAKRVKAWMDKYGSERGVFAQAEAYTRTKKHLDYYFSLPKEERSAWLKAGSPEAQMVLDYFKKYGRTAKLEKSFAKLRPALAGGTPEQRKRLEFWKQLFALPPDRRPAFILEHAQEYGIFIYGEFGEQFRHDEEQEWLRRAVGLPFSERQKAYLYVLPLLKFYNTLNSDEKPLFLRANPELQEYFDTFSTKSITGDKKLDALLGQYFKLPAGSFARSAFLREHPQVQDWFDDRGSPAEKAMRNLLEQYFELTHPLDREAFIAEHPEVAAYFERRREERQNESDIGHAFDEADPRLRPFFENADDLERAATEMRRRLRQQTLDIAGDILLRRERRRESVYSL